MKDQEVKPNSMKKIEDYLPLYYGCMVATFDRSNTRVQDRINTAWLMQAYEDIIEEGELFYTYKLILRPLSSQSREEMLEELEIIKSLGGDRTGAESCALLTAHRLKKGFDLFQLFESGLCIYESELKTQG